MDTRRGTLLAVLAAAALLSAGCQDRTMARSLQGRWTRPDGGYVLEIKGVAADGRLDAAYFNPRPIRVAEARAVREGSTIKVYIELRDENYPGSTYNLRFDPQSGRLSGDYYQAVAREHYPIFFVRMK
ncbi:MAG: hypothetical protein H6P98_1539 [Candidatus Aminicenantes bacterium]|jgi:hypothetical protein|nr:hypothetical protein [Candidatus Aminicenantes bacterium]